MKREVVPRRTFGPICGGGRVLLDAEQGRRLLGGGVTSATRADCRPTREI
jgi:hypothetical protein